LKQSLYDPEADRSGTQVHAICWVAGFCAIMTLQFGLGAGKEALRARWLERRVFKFTLSNALLYSRPRHSTDFRLTRRVRAVAQTDGPHRAGKEKPMKMLQRLESPTRLADAGLPAGRLRRLREIAATAGGVGGRTGSRARRGARGLRVLFAGPAGTGKTVAAQALAGELGHKLYRVDLGRVLNEYIGETEKNLDRVFDAAARPGAVLFFDEANALFGKRSDVKDSHDRYANVDMGDLLKRIESYDGLVILATNRRANLDPAFVRRLRYVVEFRRKAKPGQKG
jgi:hypothetical protein